MGNVGQLWPRGQPGGVPGIQGDDSSVVGPDGPPGPGMSIYAARVSDTVTLVPDATPTLLTFTAEPLDNGGMFNPAAPNQLRVVHAGPYGIGAIVQWPDGGAGTRQLRLLRSPVGGGATVEMRKDSRDAGSVNVCKVADFGELDAGDVFTLEALQTSGADVTPTAVQFFLYGGERRDTLGVAYVDMLEGIGVRTFQVAPWGVSEIGSGPDITDFTDVAWDAVFSGAWSRTAYTDPTWGPLHKLHVSGDVIVEQSRDPDIGPDGTINPAEAGWAYGRARFDPADVTTTVGVFFETETGHRLSAEWDAGGSLIVKVNGTTVHTASVSAATLGTQATLDLSWLSDQNSFDVTLYASTTDVGSYHATLSRAVFPRRAAGHVGYFGTADIKQVNVFVYMVVGYAQALGGLAGGDPIYRYFVGSLAGQDAAGENSVDVTVQDLDGDVNGYGTILTAGDYTAHIMAHFTEDAGSGEVRFKIVHYDDTFVLVDEHVLVGDAPGDIDLTSAPFTCAVDDHVAVLVWFGGHQDGGGLIPWAAYSSGTFELGL